MNQRILVGAVILALVCSFVALGQGVLAQAELSAAKSVPQVVSYQGRVSLNGAAYSGQGYFKFAVVDGAGTASYWSNDGTSGGGGEPTGAVQLTVTGGLFSVLLGQAPMQALSADVFAGPERALRVWFSQDGTAFTRLEPDRVIASVPFALQAEQAGNANTLDDLDSSAFQRRVSESCPSGFAVLEVLADGSVTCEAVEARPGFVISTLDSIGWLGTSMATGSDGLGLIAYRSGGSSFDLKVAHCEDLACTRATITPLVTAGDVGYRPSLVIGPDGLGLISFYDNSGTCALKLAHCNDLACTSATVNTVDSFYTGRFNSLVIGADGLPLISYSREIEDNFDLMVAHCNDLLCSSATKTALDTADEVGLHNAITIGSDGLGLIAYLDFTHQNLKVAHCNDLACTGASITTLGVGGTNGWYNAVTVGSDGLGLIVSGNSVLHCDDRACSSATTRTLDVNGQGYNAITTGPDGLGLVSYRSLQGLRVAHCDNAECSSASISVVDGSGYMIEVSIAIGTDGLGLIAYQDEDLGILKVVHLSNPLGTPFVQR